MSNATLTANLAALAAAGSGWTPPDVPATPAVLEQDGTWRLVLADGRTPAIHSRDAHREADREVDTLLSRTTPDLIAVIGLGLGYLLDALERRQWAGTVVALEPEPATTLAMLGRRDLTAWLSRTRLHLLFAPDFAGSSDLWRAFGDGRTAPPVVVNAALARLNPVHVASARARLERIQFEARANAGARRRFAGRYLLNSLRNLQTIAHEADAGALDGALHGRPGVIVAAGPSLDAALPALRAMQHHVGIIAVDTALPPLLAAGVSPHLVVAVDPGEANARHLTELPPCPDTWLVTEGSLDAHAVPDFAGRTFLFSVSEHQPWPWLRRHGRGVVTLRAWGSVLTTAFDLALRLGCDPVVFVGADLAYSGLQPYARGVAYEDDWRREQRWGSPLETQWANALARRTTARAQDVTGRETLTAPHLIAFRDWIVEQVRREPARRFINASGSGILQGPGLEQMGPDALPGALPTHAAGDLRAVIRSRYRPFAGSGLIAAARALGATDTPEAGAVDGTLEAWQAFAPDVSREEILAAVAHGTRGPDHAEPDPVCDDAPMHPDLFIEAGHLHAMATALPRVALTLTPAQLAQEESGAYRIRFASLAAHLMSILFTPGREGLHQDGHPLAWADDGDLQPGTYSVSREGVRFRPRCTGRPTDPTGTISLLVPPSVAALEGPGIAV